MELVSFFIGGLVFAKFLGSCVNIPWIVIILIAVFKCTFFNDFNIRLYR